MEKKNTDIELTIVMPCLNEEETIGICIKKAKNAIADLKINAEIIIADNGSTDNSKKIAKSMDVKVVDIIKKGYGNTLRGGIEASKGKYIIMGDSDDSYDFSEISPFIKKLREGFDLVMGCRMPVGGGKIMPGAMPLKHRWIGNPILTA